MHLLEQLIEQLPEYKYILVFLFSMIPICELRGAIIAAAAFGIEWYVALPMCIVANMLPVPVILLFVRRVLDWMKTLKPLRKLALKIEEKGEKNKHKVLKFAFWGLVLFVGIPLPGTGAWTGALVASMLDMRMKKALPSIFMGVVLAGVIMTLASYGFISGLEFLTRI